MEEMIQNQKKEKEEGSSILNDNAIRNENVDTATTEGTAASSSPFGGSDYDETTYDGYQVIQAANSAESRDEELESMKKARQ
eukprot:2142504-Ditylum_brightwellii.AAC.1